MGDLGSRRDAGVAAAGDPGAVLCRHVAVPAIGVPMTPLLLLAGATFGPGIGLLGSLLALALNLTLCYWIANLMRPGLRRCYADLAMSCQARKPGSKTPSGSPWPSRSPQAFPRS